MAAALKNLYARLTPSQSSTDLSGFNKAPVATQLFPKTDPEVDGEDCLHDCASCSVKLPAKWSIDESEKLYGHVKGWATHLVVATGKTDWVRDVADEKGSIMEAVNRSKVQPSNGRLMLSASNIPLPDSHHTSESSETSTTVLLLPSFTLIDNVTPSNVPNLITNFVNRGPTNTTPLKGPSLDPLAAPNLVAEPPDIAVTSEPGSLAASTADLNISSLTSRPCPHKYLILLCSQKTRDARCGQSAPLLRKEFERHLRPLGLYRDLHDERPGGVGIYFISHVGGHKFSANIMIYRRSDAPTPKHVENASKHKVDEATNGGVSEEDDHKEDKIVTKKEEEMNEAGQCIWLARVRPEDCENIVRYTVLQGKVVKPERQLRGGFDRQRQLVSW